MSESLNSQRVVIVTGGGSGIGAAISRAFVAQSDVVVVLQRSECQIEGTNHISCDLAQLESIEEVVTQVIKKFGVIDVLINNAGVMLQANTAEMSLQEWQQSIDINLTAPFLLIKHCLPYLAKSTQSGGGSIVNISSIESLGANPQHAAYCASKAGLNGLTRAVAVDYGTQQVRCNAIAPGWVDSEFNEAFIQHQADPGGFKQNLKNIHPIGRIGQAEDVAELAIWLSSDKASFITGQVWTVDGGRMTQLSLPG